MSESESSKILEVGRRLRFRGVHLPEYLLGTTSTGHRIAMLRNGAISISLFDMNASIHSWCPAIIKAAGNTANFYNQLSDEWDTFRVITYYSGNINALHNPQIAIEQQVFDRSKQTDSGEVYQFKLDQYLHPKQKTFH